MTNYAKRTALAMLVVCAGLTLVPAQLRAQSGSENGGDEPEPTAEEKEDFAKFVEAGKEAYNAGNFEEAIPFLKKAYDAIPKPALHYRIGLCYEQSNQPKKAVEYYRKFLEEKPDTKRRGAVEKKISNLEEKIEQSSKATVKIESDPSDARVFVRTEGTDEREDEARGRTPLEMTIAPGDVEVTLEKEGYEPQTKSFAAEAGETQTHSIQLETVPTDAGRARPSSGGGLGAGATIGLVVGALGAVGGGTFYGIGLHCSGISESTGKRKCSRGLYNASVISSYVGGGVGAVGLGLGMVMWMSQGGGEQANAASRSGVPLRLYVSPRSVGVSGRF